MALVSLQGADVASAQESPGLACPGPNLAPRLRQVPERTHAPILLKSYEFEAARDGVAEARRAVELQRADQVLVTELLRYDPASRVVSVPGQLHYEDSVMRVSGSDARYSFLDESGHFTAVDYGLTGSSAQGSAREVLVDSGHHSLLRGLWFTTCPGEEPQWVLTARELELDFEKGLGKAKRARLEFFDVPILYVPYITFPIDDRRKSGFLYPFISTANDNGFEFSIPYYWNIAPNQDLTTTPRYFTARGAMLTSQYRFMTRRTAGELNFDYMHNDTNSGDSRYHYRLGHDTSISRRWHSQVLVDRASDDLYFQDFGNSLASASRQYLHSRAGIHGGGRFWAFSIMADDFQVVDESVDAFNEPYRRLPRIALDVDRPLGSAGLRLQLGSELVYFDRPAGATGSRLDVFPRLEWSVGTSWGYLRPSAGYRYTSYALDHQGETNDDSPDRGTEIVSLDSGLFMERDRGNGRTQTLEPRFFYLYVPYRNQDDLPDFDSAPFTFGFSQLFHFNRFTGADRQSDANQLTLALTTRSIDHSAGRELWSMSFGQIVYFSSRKVLPANFSEPLDENASPFIAEFVLHRTSQLSSRIGAQWNWQEKQVDVAVAGVTFVADNGRHLGAEYRYRRDSLDQVDLRYYQPVNPNWRLLSRVNYSLQDSDLLAAEIGFEYDSCCWGLSVVAKRFLRNRAGEHRDAVYLQLVLKGLGSLGRRSAPLFYDLAD